MRVLLTSILVRSGVLTHVWDLAKYFKENGIDVRIALYTPTDVLKKMNINKREIPSFIHPLKKIVPVSFYVTDNELLSIARKQKVELIHAHSRLTFPSSYRVGKKLSIPLVLTLHGVFPWLKYYAQALSYAEQIIAIGPAQAKSLDLNTTKKVSIIPNGINTKMYHPISNKQMEKSEALKIIWFGRTNGKASEGVKVLDKSVERLKRDGYNIEAKMIGRAEGVKPKSFDVHGWVNNPLKYLQWGHIAFGHGRSLREAMACGNVGFLLGDGYGGLVIRNWFQSGQSRPLSAIPAYKLPKANEDVLARDILLLHENRSYLQSLRLESRRIAERFFDIEHMGKQTMIRYKNALGDYY